MSSPKIGFLCGSLRSGSINQKLSKAIQSIAAQKGADSVDIDLANYDLPLFHGDLSTPDSVQTLINDMLACDGIVVISPEYNGSLPPVLKNAIDWTSTVSTDHIKWPVYGVASCTPGSSSGLMVMRQIQFILLRLGANLVPTQVGCGNADKAFDKNGELVASRTRELAEAMIDQMIGRMASSK